MADLFKFRCYQCQKLIGAPPSRYGTLVKCPKCATELVVPSPDDDSPPVDDPDVDAFRPEDLGLRIDLEPISRPVDRAPTAPEPVGPDPIAFLNQVTEVDPEYRDDQARHAVDGNPEAEPAPDLPGSLEEPLVSRRRGRRPASAAPRARDVVLPRTAAVAWALFGLLGLAFAFLSGLLIGQRLGK